MRARLALILAGAVLAGIGPARAQTPNQIVAPTVLPNSSNAHTEAVRRKTEQLQEDRKKAEAARANQGTRKLQDNRGVGGQYQPLQNPR